MKKITLILFSLFIVFALLQVSCVKTPFDAPTEIHYSVDFETNPEYTMKTIKEFKDLYNLSSADTALITENFVIKGTVISDDTEGNFYKTITIQDSTGGIIIPIDAYDLYADYTQGQLIYITCKGLVLQNYKNSLQLNFLSNEVLESIPSTAMAEFIYKCDGGLPIVPNLVAINELGVDDDLINTLVKLENVEFSVADTSKTYYYEPDGYYDAPNRIIENCTVGNVILRNSEYATFADTKVSKGNGSIIAVYSKYNSDLQLYIRSLSDVDMEGERCAK